MKKKVLSVLLAVCLLVGALPMAASAEAPLQTQNSSISIKENESLFVAGVLSERYYEINSSNTGTVYLWEQP